MSWRKLLRPGPMVLGDGSLDEVLDRGSYVQTSTANATKQNGYPFDGAVGIYELKQWSESSLIGVYVLWNGGIYTRTYRWGAWRPWLDAMGQVIE